MYLKLQQKYRAVMKFLFKFTGKHKWNYFIPIPLYRIQSSIVSNNWLATDCSFLG